MRGLMLGSFVLALAATPAWAEYFTRSMPSGGKLLGLFYTSINPDCSLMGYPSLRLTSGPSAGSVGFVKGLVFPYFPPGNPRSACNSRRVPAIVIDYRPPRGYVGSDSFSVEVIFPNGAERGDTININVK